MAKKTQEELKRSAAVVSFLPIGSGDGYGYGGGAILTIGDRSIHFGEDGYSDWLANEVAERWNVSMKETK